MTIPRPLRSPLALAPSSAARALLVLAALSGGACKEEEPKPPAIGEPDCQGATCSPVGSKGNPSGGGGSGSGGDTGGAGGAVAGTATVTGQVQILADALLQAGAPYPGKADIVVDVAAPSTTAQWNGAAPFTIEGVSGGVRQFRTSPIDPSGEVFGTLLLYRVTPPSFEAVFPVVDGQVLRTIVASLPTPQTLTNNTAHAVVTVSDAAGAPIAGTTVVASGVGAIAYDLGDDYSGTKTGARGTILLVNIAAAATLKLTLTSAAGTSSTVTIPVLPNVVTFAGALQ